MATAKTKSKAPAEKKTSSKPKSKKSGIDFEWLGEKSEKQTVYFLEQVSAKRQCDQDRVIAACVAWCASQARRYHGLSRLVQTIELETKCRM